MADNSHKAENNKRMEISQQQVSIAAALCLMLAFCMFIAGVFWGKKSILEISPTQLTTYSFADTLYDTFYGNFTNDSSGDRKSLGIAKDVEYEDVPENVEASELEAGAINTQIAEAENPEPEKFYYAQLAGFNSIQEAQECMQKLQAKGVLVRNLERTSKTRSGKTRVWYAVVTEAFINKNELRASVNRIKHLLTTKNILMNTLTTEQKNLLFGKERRTL